MAALTHGLIIKHFNTEPQSCYLAPLHLINLCGSNWWEPNRAARWGRRRGEGGARFSYRVRAITLFFLGCWLTGLPTVLLFFSEPFRANSLCFSAEDSAHVLTLLQPVTQSACDPSDSIISLPARRDDRRSVPHQTLLACLLVYHLLLSGWNLFSGSVAKEFSFPPRCILTELRNATKSFVSWWQYCDTWQWHHWSHLHIIVTRCWRLWLSILHNMLMAWL